MTRRRIHIAKGGGRGEGFSMQIPPNWDDGSGKIRHIGSGPNKGRVCWNSKHEAREIAKRVQDTEEKYVEFDQ